MHNYAQLRSGVPSRRTLARWAKGREKVYKEQTEEELRREIRLLKLALGDLVDYCELNVRPGSVPSWTAFRRRFSRARGML